MSTISHELYTWRRGTATFLPQLCGAISEAHRVCSCSSGWIAALGQLSVEKPFPGPSLGVVLLVDVVPRSLTFRLIGMAHQLQSLQVIRLTTSFVD